MLFYLLKKSIKVLCLKFNINNNSVNILGRGECFRKLKQENIFDYFKKLCCLWLFNFCFNFLKYNGKLKQNWNNSILEDGVNLIGVHVFFGYLIYINYVYNDNVKLRYLNYLDWKQYNDLWVYKLRYDPAYEELLKKVHREEFYLAAEDPKPVYFGEGIAIEDGMYDITMGLDFYSDIYDFSYMDDYYDVDFYNRGRRVTEKMEYGDLSNDMKLVLEFRKKLAFEKGIKKSSMSNFFRMGELRRYYIKTKRMYDLTIGFFLWHRLDLDVVTFGFSGESPDEELLASDLFPSIFEDRTRKYAQFEYLRIKYGRLKDEFYKENKKKGMSDTEAGKESERQYDQALHEEFYRFNKQKRVIEVSKSYIKMAPYIDPGFSDILFGLFGESLFLRKDDEKGGYTGGGTVEDFSILLQYRSLYHPYMPGAFKINSALVGNSSGYYEMLNMAKCWGNKPVMKYSRLLSNILSYKSYLNNLLVELNNNYHKIVGLGGKDFLESVKYLLVMGSMVKVGDISEKSVNSEEGIKGNIYYFSSGMYEYKVLIYKYGYDFGMYRYIRSFLLKRKQFKLFIKEGIFKSKVDEYYGFGWKSKSAKYYMRYSKGVPGQNPQLLKSFNFETLMENSIILPFGVRKKRLDCYLNMRGRSYTDIKADKVVSVDLASELFDYNPYRWEHIGLDYIFNRIHFPRNLYNLEKKILEREKLYKNRLRIRRIQSFGIYHYDRDFGLEHLAFIRLNQKLARFFKLITKRGYKEVAEMQIVLDTGGIRDHYNAYLLKLEKEEKYEELKQAKRFKKSIEYGEKNYYK